MMPTGDILGLRAGFLVAPVEPSWRLITANMLTTTSQWPKRFVWKKFSARKLHERRL
jgi:hypothetical protein